MSDSKRTVTNTLRECWEDAKTGLIDNQYVFKGFWTQGPGGSGDGRWREGFDRDRQSVDSSASGMAITCPAEALFDRLYVLRNQLHHGGSTQAGSLNRQQVEAGAAVMARLIPKFIGVIIDNPDADWGKPYYPVMPS